MRLTLPPHLEHARDQLQRLADAGGPEADLVLRSLGISAKPPKKPDLHVVKAKRIDATISSTDLAFAKSLAKGLSQ
jgi:hypothetical protein